MAELSVYFTDSNFVFVEKRKGTTKLKDYGSAKIPNGLIENGRIKDVKKLTKFVETVLSYSNVTARKTNLLLHEKIVTYSSFDISDDIKKRGVKSFINKKVIEEKITPFSDPIYDYDVSSILGEQKVAVFSSSQSILNDYVSVLSNVGLRVTTTEIPALASYRLFFECDILNYHESNLMFVNIYNNMISINIFSENHPVFNVIFDTNLELNEDNYTELIQRIQDEIYRMNNYFVWNINQGKLNISSVVLMPFTTDEILNNKIKEVIQSDNQTGIDNVRYIKEDKLPYDLHLKYLLTMSKLF